MPHVSFCAFLYYPYYEGFHLLPLLADWLRLVCFNFPFAFFTQLFFIQPLVRKIFITGARFGAKKEPKPANYGAASV